MSLNLNPAEARVIGCLMEKAVTTPEQYPLTLNALTNACNQKSSRDPVMQLEQGLVQRTARKLAEQHLVMVREGAKAGVEKYTQRICNTPMAEWQFSEAEYAVICLLLLRGPQTPGELRTRSGRLHEFADNAAVAATLENLIERGLVARLPRKPGRQDHEYMHQLAGEMESAAVEVVAPAAGRETRPGRIEQLEARVAALEAALESLTGTSFGPAEHESTNGTAGLESREEDDEF
ncbi:MAG: YceH family protein [Pseudomonadota bacterium]